MLYLIDRGNIVDTEDGVVSSVDFNKMSYYRSLGLVIKKLPRLNLGTKINVYDRVVAIMIIDGKLYESDGNHQECLQSYLHDKKTSMYETYGIEMSPDNADYDSDVEAVSEITYNMFLNCDAYGFDIFDYDYLVAHFEDNLLYCFDLIKDYAIKHGYRLGVFKDGIVYSVLGIC